MIVEAWREGRTPMETYPAGSTGPSSWSTHPGLSRTGEPLDTAFVPDPEEVARQRRALAYPPEHRVSAQRAG